MAQHHQIQRKKQSLKKKKTRSCSIHLNELMTRQLSNSLIHHCFSRCKSKCRRIYACSLWKDQQSKLFLAESQRFNKISPAEHSIVSESLAEPLISRYFVLLDRGRVWLEKEAQSNCPLLAAYWNISSQKTSKVAKKSRNQLKTLFFTE
jgi:hypothetical protein